MINSLHLIAKSNDMKYLLAIAIFGLVLTGCEKETIKPNCGSPTGMHTMPAPQPAALGTNDNTGGGTTTTVTSGGTDTSGSIVDPNSDSDANKRKNKN